MPRKSSEAGFVLLSVLVITGLIGAIILALSWLARDDYSEIRLHLDLLKARAYADNALVRSIAAIGNPSDPIHSLVLRYGEAHILTFDTIRVEVRVEPESGKIDLNHAPLGLIGNALQLIAPTRNVAADLIERIAELRKPGRFIAAPTAILTSSQRFDPLQGAIEHNFTVLTGSTGILPDVAPLVVLFSVLAERSPVDLSSQQANTREVLTEAITRDHSANVSAGRPIYTIRAKVVDVNLPPVRRTVQFALHHFPLVRQSDISLIRWSDESWD